MQLFDRNGVRPPAYLTSARVREARRRFLAYYQLEPEQRAQTRPPSPVSLEDGSVHDQLQRLFRGKCAFCEQREKTTVYRFRPVSDAAPFESRRDGHLYYSWLSDAWENLYSICEGCEPKDPTRFPVRGKRAPLPELEQVKNYVENGGGRWTYGVAEQPRLIDPCRPQSVVRDLRFNFDGEIVPRSPSGRATIEHFRLNRPDLTKKRGDTFRQYFNQLLTEVERPSAALSTLEFPTLEFGGGWWLLLREILAPVAPGGLRALSRPESLHRLVQELQGTPRAEFKLLELRHAATSTDGATGRQPKSPSHRRGDVQLKTVSVRNFKGLEQIQLQLPEPRSHRTDWDESWRPQTPALLLLGENATGKSSLLEAIALALCEPSVLQELALNSGEFLLDPEQLGEERRARPREARVVLGFDDGTEHALTVTRTRIKALDHERLPPVFAYGAFRQFGPSPEASPVHAVITLFKCAELLPNPEGWLAGLESEDFDMVARELRWILSVDGTYDVIERSGGRCFVVTSTRRSDGREVKRRTPLTSVSSGFRSVLGMACDIMRGLMEASDFSSFQAARGVALIDEIEAHLHPRWKLQVMRGMRRVFPRMTFIATSHDPLCLRGMEAGEVAVLQRTFAPDAAATRSPTHVEILTELPDIGQLTVDQLLTSDLFNLFSADPPDTERAFARVADILARRRDGMPLEDEDARILERFEQEIAAALPVGATETQRIVQDAVAAYLHQRDREVGERLRALRRTTRDRIIAALDGVEE